MSPACVMVDGEREYEIERGTPAWSASLEWAKFHGLDPNSIPDGSYIERDASGCRILFTEFVRTGPNGDVLVEDLEPVTIERVEQGEAPPLPFPREVTG